MVDLVGIASGKEAISSESLSWKIIRYDLQAVDLDYIHILLVVGSRLVADSLLVDIHLEEVHI